MFKVGQFYITLKGRLVKVFNQFAFQDGFVFNAAIYQPGTGWVAVRYKPDGTCNLDAANNNMRAVDTFESYLTFLTITTFFNRANNTWIARATDPFGSMIVDLQNNETPERALTLIQMGAQEKLLTWMREAGYDEEMKETIA